MLIVIGAAFAQNRQVNFESGTLKEALAKAKAANKLVFFDGYTNWCPPCKYMASKVFTVDKVADFMNDKFVSVKFEVDKGEGKEHAAKYSIRALPTFLVLDADGNVVHRFIGRNEVDALLAKLNEAFNPETSFAGYAERYKAGNRNPDFLYTYFEMLNSTYAEKEAAAVAVDYLGVLEPTQKATKKCWPIYDQFVKEMLDTEFDFLVTNRAKFAEAVGDSVVAIKERSVYNLKMVTLLSTEGYSKESCKKARLFLAKHKPADAKRYSTFIDLAEAIAAGKIALVFDLTEKLFKQYDLNLQESFGIFTNVVPVVVEHGSKAQMQQLAKRIDEQVAKTAIPRIQKNFQKLKEPLEAKLGSAK